MNTGWIVLIALVAILYPYILIAQDVQKFPATRGVYGNPAALLAKGYSFKQLGVTAIFVRSVSLNKETFNAAKKAGVSVYVEFPTLNGAYYLQNHPEAWPIDEKGERSPKADWFMGICPTNPEFLAHRVQELKSILEQYAVDGIWLDYLHWHAQFETPDPILPETCFCDRCIAQFRRQASVPVPAGLTPTRAQWILAHADSTWRSWRSNVLTGWVTEMKRVVNEMRPGALLGIYYCPWYPTDFGRAQYRNLGLDISKLSRIADVLSPMLFHRMMGRPVGWVGEYNVWLGDFIGDRSARIWPIVQAHNKPDMVSAGEFKQAMINGSRPPVTGVMMFSAETIAGEAEKLEIVRELYGQ